MSKEDFRRYIPLKWDWIYVQVAYIRMSKPLIVFGLFEMRIQHSWTWLLFLEFLVIVKLVNKK